LLEPLTGALALAVKRPVRLALTRSEEMLVSNPTPAAHMEVKLGARRDGTFTALEARLVMDTGAYPGSPMGGAAFAISNCYRIPNLSIHGIEVMTNRLGPGAYRAPGNPQASFAIDSTIDDLAAQLGLDPLEVRLRNAVVEGDLRPDGKPWPRIGLRQCLERLRAHPLWRARAAGQLPRTGRVREGVGTAVGGWRGGLEPATSLCHMDPEGTIVVVVGAVDLTGTHTTFRIIAAETLGVDIERVKVVGSDSASAPYSGGAGGSKTIYTVGMAVQRAAEDARQQILALAAQQLEAAVEDLEISGDRVRVRGLPPGTGEITLAKLGSLTSGMGARNAPIAGRGTSAQTANAPGFAAHLAHVRVDLDTGIIEVLDYVAAQDVGRAINPAAVDGQIIGAVGQGVGWGLYEQIVHDASGQVVTGTLMDYALPRAHAVPPVETLLVEVPSPDGPFGARGVGEPPVIPVAAAIANAIHDATGLRLTEMPITPERLWQALATAGTPARAAAD
jgi:CO/xanthine dehydrogenase Mo-binding subunit